MVLRTSAPASEAVPAAWGGRGGLPLAGHESAPPLPGAAPPPEQEVGLIATLKVLPGETVRCARPLKVNGTGRPANEPVPLCGSLGGELQPWPQFSHS